MLVLIFILLAPSTLLASPLASIDQEIKIALADYNSRQQIYIEALNQRIKDKKFEEPSASSIEKPQVDLGEIKNRLNSYLQTPSLSQAEKKRTQKRLQQLERFERFNKEATSCAVDISCEEPGYTCDELTARKKRDCQGLLKGRTQKYQKCLENQMMRVYFLQAFGTSTLGTFEGFSDKCENYGSPLRDLNDFTSAVNAQLEATPEARDKVLKRIALKAHRNGLGTAFLARKVTEGYYGSGEPKFLSCDEFIAANPNGYDSKFLGRCRQTELELADPNRRKLADISQSIRSGRQQVQSLTTYGELARTSARTTLPVSDQTTALSTVETENLQRSQFCTERNLQSITRGLPHPEIAENAFSESLKLGPVFRDRPGSQADPITIGITRAKNEFLEKVSDLEQEHREQIGKLLPKTRTRREQIQADLNTQNGTPGKDSLINAMKINPIATIQTLLESEESLEDGEYCQLLKYFDQQNEDRRVLLERIAFVSNVAGLGAFLIPVGGAGLSLALRAATTAALRKQAAVAARDIGIKRVTSSATRITEITAPQLGNVGLGASVGGSAYRLVTAADEQYTLDLRSALSSLDPASVEAIEKLDQEMGDSLASLGLAGTGYVAGRVISGAVREGFGIARTNLRIADREKNQGFRGTFQGIINYVKKDRNDTFDIEDEYAYIAGMRTQYGGANAKITGHGRETRVLTGLQQRQIEAAARERRELNKTLLRNAGLANTDYRYIYSISRSTIDAIRSKLTTRGPQAFSQSFRAYHQSLRSPQGQKLLSDLEQHAKQVFPNDIKTQQVYIQDQIESYFIRFTTNPKSHQLSNVQGSEQLIANYMKEATLHSGATVKTSTIFLVTQGTNEVNSKTLGLVGAALRTPGNTAGRLSPAVASYPTNRFLIDSPLTYTNSPENREQILQGIDSEVYRNPRGRIRSPRDAQTVRTRMPLAELNDRLTEYARTCGER